MPWVSENQYEADKEELIRLRREVRELREIRSQSQLFVAGAMRQGFVNFMQREALLHAFMRLVGLNNQHEEKLDRALGAVLAFIQPRGWRSVIPPTSPPDEPKSPDYREPEYR